MGASKCPRKAIKMKTYKHWIPRLIAIVGIYAMISLGMIMYALVSIFAGLESYWMQDHIDFFYSGIFFVFVFAAMFIGSWRNASEYVKKNFEQSKKRQDSND